MEPTTDTPITTEASVGTPAEEETKKYIETLVDKMASDTTKAIIEELNTKEVAEKLGLINPMGLHADVLGMSMLILASIVETQVTAEDTIKREFYIRTQGIFQALDKFYKVKIETIDNKVETNTTADDG
ncbi:MAG: hypothetical protein DRQ88_05985 [Epsilonproteobacteria bacterium]|nr:MAG: hypothetical protein DRQ88_05985 [Campylobacterota bacterium]